jgi:flagellar protein FliS
MTPVRQLQTYRENQITTTDSCTVLLMLYDGAIDALKRAVCFMAQGDMAAKGRDLLRANDIINQFIASLDYEVGGEIAQNLDGLYRYVLDQILLANLNNDPSPLSTAIALLSTLRSAWEQAIASQRKPVALGDV